MNLMISGVINSWMSAMMDSQHIMLANPNMVSLKPLTSATPHITTTIFKWRKQLVIMLSSSLTILLLRNYMNTAPANKKIGKYLLVTLRKVYPSSFMMNNADDERLKVSVLTMRLLLKTFILDLHSHLFVFVAFAVVVVHHLCVPFLPSHPLLCLWQLEVTL